MFIRIILIAFFCFVMIGLAEGQSKRDQVNLIFDSDMGPDYDDAGAITILHALADKGEVHILATMASTKYEGVAGVLNIFNTYFNRPKIPLGVPKGQAVTTRDWQHWTDTLLANYPHQIKTNEEAADAVALYRKILVAQPDKSVTIVTIGFLVNLSNLLNSPADQYSALSGRALIRKKVKLLVSMAGKYPEGYEFNIMQDIASAKNVFEHWETPVIFSGFEIGEKIKTGIPLIRNAAISHDPVKDVFRISIPKAAEDSAGRKSWDETAVLVAIEGYKPYYTLHTGKIKVAENGHDTWDDKGTGQAYLVEKQNPIEVQKLINELIMYKPAGK